MDRVNLNLDYRQQGPPPPKSQLHVDISLALVVRFESDEDYFNH